ncbi:MAG: hypothetical protein ABIT01_20755, partial [Thermoanaerobaculia bacterium]
VRGQLTGRPPEAFILTGEDWFPLSEATTPGWAAIRSAVESEQERLTAAVSDLSEGKLKSPLSETERFDLVLGITCHAVYHAGQVQLIKKLGAD